MASSNMSELTRDATQQVLHKGLDNVPDKVAHAAFTGLLHEDHVAMTQKLDALDRTPKTKMDQAKDKGPMTGIGVIVGAVLVKAADTAPGWLDNLANLFRSTN